MLQCVAVCCSVLQCVAVCCSVLQCVAVCCSAYISRPRTSAMVPHLRPESFQDESHHVCCSVLQCVAVCCSVLQCVAVCCSVLQCVAVSYHDHFSSSHGSLSFPHTHTHTRTHTCVLTHALGGDQDASCHLQGAFSTSSRGHVSGSVLQVERSRALLASDICGTWHCSVVQCGAVWRSVVQCGAVWRSVVQCVAVCCSLLQSVAG